jgi:S1-C subfamily serine protease
MKSLSSVRLSQILLLIIIVLATVSLALRFLHPSDPADTRFAVVMILDEGGIIGTGTLIDAQTVLTSKHFVAEGKRYGVRFMDASLASVASLSLHPSLDLALLSLDLPHRTQYPRISSQKPSLQGPVIAFGTQTQDTTIAEHRGVVLSQSESLEIGGNLFTGLLLTDIPFQSGYSGGPLMNLDGEIIGVHTAYEPSGKSGWSTPVSREIISQMVNGKQ